MPNISLLKKPRPGEAWIRGLLFTSALVSILITLGIILALAGDALRFFTSPLFDWFKFLTQTTWDPPKEVQGVDPGSVFIGIWPLLGGTLMTSLIAMAVAGPLGLAIGVYLSEYASPKLARVVKPILEILAGVPSIVFGYFAINFITPSFQVLMGDLIQPLNALSAGLVMGMLILPMVASMTEDALAAVPGTLKQASLAMGATRLETALQVTLPAATSGIVAALILGLSRAIGETMIVALAAGSASTLNMNPLGSVDTMTGFIVRVTKGDASFGTFQYDSIFAIGLTLFLFTFALNILSRKIIRRFREVYD